MNDATKPQTAAAAAGIKPKQKRFDAEFSERLRDLQRRARAVGLSWSEICRATGSARATPDRWMTRPPKSVETMAAMEACVEQAEAIAREDKV